MAKIVLHLKAGDVSGELKGWHLALYREIRALCGAHGIPFECRARDADIRVGTRSLPDRRFDDGNLHIIDDRSLQAANVLNAGVAYFWEYWHLDAQGTKAFSSIGGRHYEPAAVSETRSRTFAANLRKRYRDKRRSKYDQPMDQRSFAQGALAVFFQGDYPVKSGASTWDDLEILEAVQAEAGDRPIVVKPHPHSSTKTDMYRLQKAAQMDTRITVTDANVHDILAASACTVSVNSTVALEGFLQGVPAILFGRADFHHVAACVDQETRFAAALDQALARQVDYDRYLAWYFLKNCLHLRSGRLHDRLFERFEGAGFPRSRLQRSP